MSTPRPLQPVRRPLLILLGLLAIACFFLQVGQRFHSLPAQNPPAPQAAKESHPAPIIAGEPSREIVKKEGVNAGDFYLRAITLLSLLSEEEQARFKKVTEKLDGEDAAKLFEKIQPIMELLRQAAAADYCEWGIDRSMNEPWPWSSVQNKGQALGNLALWNAAYVFPSDPSAAISDLNARASLGRNLCENALGFLVNTQFERTAGDLMRGNAGLLDESTLKQARDLIESTMTDSDVTKAYKGEAEFGAATLDRLAASEEARKNWLEQFKSSPELSKLFNDPALLKSEIDYEKGIQQQRIAAMLLPEAQFAAWQTTIESTFKDHPLAGEGGGGAYRDLRSSLEKARVQNAMLSAGLTVMLNGPGQLAAFRDPSNGALFTYTVRPDGFELRSTYTQHGKPVTMQFAKEP